MVWWWSSPCHIIIIIYFWIVKSTVVTTWVGNWVPTVSWICAGYFDNVQGTNSKGIKEGKLQRCWLLECAKNLQMTEGLQSSFSTAKLWWMLRPLISCIPLQLLPVAPELVEETGKGSLSHDNPPEPWNQVIPYCGHERMLHWPATKPCQERHGGVKFCKRVFAAFRKSFFLVASRVSWNLDATCASCANEPLEPLALQTARVLWSI